MQRPTLAFLTAFCALLGASASAQSLTTTFANDNAQNGNMFNVRAKTKLTVDRLEVHFENVNNPAPCGAACTAGSSACSETVAPGTNPKR